MNKKNKGGGSSSLDKIIQTMDQTELPLDAPAKSYGACSYSAEFTTTALGKKLSRCKDVIGTIKRDSAIHVVSAAEWSAEHMIAAIADQLSPADLMFATWSASDASLSRLCAAMSSGAIRSCRAIVDWRVKVRKPNAYTMLRSALQSCDLRLTSCHAKVYLLSGNEMHVSIVSSANLTSNPRIEASVITESKAVYDFHKSWMDAEINNAKPFDEASK